MSTKLTTYDLPLNRIKRAYGAMLADPAPLALDGASLGAGLPAEELDLPAIERLLGLHRTSLRARRALWLAIAHRFQTGEAEWAQAALGLAYPGLTAAFLAEGKASRGDWHDLQGELVAGFLAALAGLEARALPQVDPGTWLCVRAAAALRAARNAEQQAPAATGLVPEDGAPVAVGGSPQEVLDAAVRAGVLDPAQAELLEAAYLDGESREAMARRLKVSLTTLHRRRAEALARLMLALDGGVLQAS